MGGRVAEALAQWAGGRPFCFFARAGRVGVEILSSKTGWAWVGTRTRPALSEVLVCFKSRRHCPCAFTGQFVHPERFPSPRVPVGSFLDSILRFPVQFLPLVVFGRILKLSFPELALFVQW